MIAERRGKVSGVLHLGVGQSFGRLHVIPHLKAFQDCYPELELEVSLFDHRTSLVDEGLDSSALPLTKTSRKGWWGSGWPTSASYWRPRRITC